VNTFKTFIFYSFIRPFLLTLSVVLTILLMQFLWKYIDDLIGKGLEWYIIIELLWYSSITLIPIALPLAVLLASMMLTGGLSEKSELIAINSLGQPFTYIMKPLFLFTLLISIFSFIISNYSIPYANLKATTLMYDIMKKKMNINIQEKVFFSEIDGYSIRIDQKLNNGMMKDIIIYDYTNTKGVKKIFISETGKMSITSDNNFLLIQLYNGSYYNEENLKNKEEYILQTTFDEYSLKLDLSSFQMERTTSDRFSNRAKTMNTKELIQNSDSLKQELFYLNDSFSKSLLKHIQIIQEKKLLTQNVSESEFEKKYSSTNHHTFNLAIQEMIKLHQKNLAQQTLLVKKFNKFQVELYRKFTLSIACLIMLIIGGPIGAIIKKGGFGLPVIFSIFLFLIYHVLSITGEKMVKKDIINPIIGMFSSTFIIMIIGVVLIVIVNNNFGRIWVKK